MIPNNSDYVKVSRNLAHLCKKNINSINKMLKGKLNAECEFHCVRSSSVEAFYLMMKKMSYEFQCCVYPWSVINFPRIIMSGNIIEISIFEAMNVAIVYDVGDDDSFLCHAELPRHINIAHTLPATLGQYFILSMRK